MSDAYWRYSDSRQPPAVSSLPGKRPRSDYDVPSGREMSGYYSRDDERVPHRAIRDTESINASYDRYLRSGQIPYGGADAGRLPGSGMSSHSIDDLRIASDHRMGSDPRMGSDLRMGSDPRMANVGAVDPGMKGRGSSLGSGRHEVSLPPDASSTLFVEGLPANCTRREVAHIFRPFVGYKEVRLVTKESRHPGGDPLVLCFVDFLSPPHAATAMDALQEATQPNTGKVSTDSHPKSTIRSNSIRPGQDQSGIKPNPNPARTKFDPSWSMDDPNKPEPEVI